MFFASFQFNVKPAYASEVAVTLTSSPATGSGFVAINGTAVTTPYKFSAQVGDSETIAAVSPANTVTGQSQYVWASWSDSGAQSHTIIIGSSSKTYTAHFQQQYYLTVLGGYSTTGQGWYKSGTSATASSNRFQSAQGNTIGLVGLWSLNEGYGTTVDDSSGNGNNGALTGSASWTTGIYGNGVAFDGNGNASISIPYSSSLTMATQISVFAWVNLKQTIQPAFEFMQYGGTDFILYVYTDGAQARFMGAVSINGTMQYGEGTNNFTYGTWHYIGFTYDGQHLTNWIDGQQGNSMVLTGNIDSIAQPMTMNGRGQHKGVVDEVSIYNRALSPSEISSLYNRRMVVTNWQLDGTNQNPNRQYSDTFTTSNITMSTYHTVVFTSTIQYLVSAVVNLKVTDYLGIPISGAQVTFNFANGTTVQLTTGSNGNLSLGLIAMGTFRATIYYMGTTTVVYGDASTQAEITGKIFASYPTFSLIGGGATIIAVGSMLFHLYRRSPLFQAKTKGYFRVNWGAPFIMGFMLLFLVAAISLSLSFSSFADGVAMYAFYALVVGVVLQLASFLKYRKRDGKS